MIAYIARRFLTLVPIWICVGTLSFFIIHLTPGDPAALMLGQEALSHEGLEAARELLGLDKSLIVQLGDFLAGAARGDLGESFFLGQAVSTAIWSRLPVTLALAISSLVVSILIGAPLGILASLRPGSKQDALIMTISVVGLSTPSFLLGLALIYVFSVTLGWLPVGRYVPFSRDFLDGLQHILMPALSLGVMNAALIARMTRSSMLEVLLNDYIRTARSKGIVEREVIWKHALRNAALPIVTTVGLVFALLIGGAFITEAVFTLPGIGTLIVSAVKRRDYPVVQGGLLFLSTAVLLINLVIDIIYSYLDPRIKYS
jgi:peptide/nickel transport system permease protein